MERDRIYGVRDPFGNRPLCIGKIMADSQGKLLKLAKECEQYREKVKHKNTQPFFSSSKNL